MLRANRVLLFSPLVLALLFLLAAGPANGQGKQAVVVLRSDQSSGGCDGNVDLSFQIIVDPKLNNKDEIRLLSPVASSVPSLISRKAYEDSGKRKLRDLYALKWEKDNVLSAVSVSGQGGFLALPDDMKPQKGMDESLASFYGVTLTGEERTGKQKRKLDIPLRSIARVFFISEGAPVNDSLFNHAAEEASVAIWEAYLKKTNGYRSSEANAKMHEALVQCARADLSKFVDGDYAFLAKVRERVARTQSIKDDETVRRLAADVNRAQQEVENARNLTEQLIKAEKWDEALTAADPIKKYLTTWPELKEMYEHTLRQSHERHLDAANKAWVAGQLETSLNECSIAWDRLKDSEPARACVCRARNEIAVRDSQQNRKINRPKEAMELLQEQIADSDCKADPRLAKNLTESKCEYSQQLFARSRQLLGIGGAATTSRRGPRRPVSSFAGPAVKEISMANKNDFREAREQLILASELCPEDEIRKLLMAANRKLADFCKDEARKALQRNDDGTAYVYLVSAQAYMPDDAEISGLLAQARERFQERTRVSVGVVLQNEARGPEGAAVIAEVTDAINSAATSSGLAQPNILDSRQAAAAWQAIQAGRALNTPTVIFAGTVLSAGVDYSEDPRSVQSSYSYQNPRWKEADRVHDAANEEYKNCKKRYGDAACGSLASRVAELRAYRDQIQQTITESYSYRENPKHMAGVARMSLRANDSISRGARSGETLQASDEWNCVERTGVNERDYRVRENYCPAPDAREFFGRIAGKIKSDAFLHATTQLRELPLSYYRRAQSAANRQQSVEDYLRFVFLTRDKSGTEAQQAKAYLTAFDPELTTDGVIR
ncbi:MAG TPA: hypothetical protein VJ875_15680 [Pyrinomonadaceae bacterium]|nr:hypothetical protein [Pyrinomonadaceae bacterium]